MITSKSTSKIRDERFINFMQSGLVLPPLALCPIVIVNAMQCWGYSKCNAMLGSS